MVSKSPKGQPKARNFYLVLNDIIQSNSATWKLNADSLDDALNTVWMLYDASLEVKELKRTEEMKKVEENLDKNHARVSLPSRKNPGKKNKKEYILYREHYEKTGGGQDMITYPWKNATTENGTNVIMFNLMHRSRGGRIRATRLEVRVQSKAHDGDTITTPAPKNPHEGSGELMTGIGNDGDRARFREAVERVMNRNLKVTERERMRKETAKKQWTDTCRLKELKKGWTCTYAYRRDDGENRISKHCEQENKNCLLASARKNLHQDQHVTMAGWMNIWDNLAPE